MSVTYKIYFPLVLLTLLGIGFTITGLYTFMNNPHLSYIVIVFIDLFLVFFLVYLLNKVIKYPVFRLLEGLRKINKEIKEGKSPVEVYESSRLKYDYHDEIGVISVTINTILRLMSHTFKKYQRLQNDTSEYLKAIYAGGLVSIGDIHGDIIYVNEELCKISGYSLEELQGQPHSIFRNKETPAAVYENMWKTIQAGKVYKNVLKNMRKDGTYFYANTTIVPIINDKNEITKYISYRDDITELVESKQKLKETYSKDQLTNLGNRFKMLMDIEKESYLAIIDINYFREINDFYGHMTGDAILKNLAQKLDSFFCWHGMEAYHLNGDEFAVLASGNTISKKDFYSSIRKFIIQHKHAELSLDEKTNINLRFTCGISYDGSNLVNSADIAHKHAKKINKEIVEYSEEINIDDEYKKNLMWTNELRSAIKEKRIKAFYQPIFNSKTDKIEKYETLMRLIKKDGEIVSPIHFLNIAKRTRLYKQLTKTIVMQAFEKFSQSDLEFSINLSVEDITTYDVGSWIFDLAVSKGVNERLVLELVESEGIESFEDVNRFIQKAKEYNVKIAIDDFGTGYSNFEYLIKLNADYLKIDGSLIKEIDKDEKICGVVETIIAFAKKNNIKVVGEFIATKEIYDKAVELGIELKQGYYLGHPLGELV